MFNAILGLMSRSCNWINFLLCCFVLILPFSLLFFTCTYRTIIIGSYCKVNFCPFHGIFPVWPFIVILLSLFCFQKYWEISKHLLTEITLLLLIIMSIFFFLITPVLKIIMNVSFFLYILDNLPYILKLMKLIYIRINLFLLSRNMLNKADLSII